MSPVVARIHEDENDGILRRLFGRRPSALRGREAAVIAISSGKGGTGKSFVATNLAVALSRSGRRVLLVDCDFGLGTAHLLLGVNPRLTVQHLLNRQVTIEEVVVATPFGPDLVPAGSGISRLASLSPQEMLVVAESLASLAGAYDVVLLDTAAGISPQGLLTLLLSRQVVLVTNPEIAALTDAYALIKCLARQASPPDIGVIVNRVAARGMGVVTHRKLAHVSGRFVRYEPRYLGEIPDDPDVTQRRLGQPPLIASHPECGAARGIAEVVNALVAAGDLHPTTGTSGSGLLHRFRHACGEA